MNLNFYFLPIPIPIPGILADISRYLPILADISANFTDTDTDIEYFQHTDTRYRFPWIHTDTDTDTDYFETYRYRYRYQVSVSVSVSVYRLIPGIGRSLDYYHVCTIAMAMDLSWSFLEMFSKVVWGTVDEMSLTSWS